ncbi:LIF receptor subunit alpha b isoform X2 [Ctenopharyngodon idella]|uniref:LIF receptor subunit alpha b isoform X2 n=1 Tax=Ctenopharyngodon idella TaxID=7959 RepID=UPI002232A25A|nr:LIF receptor subunit alpha b isoform X2 [Ctenopharyngodon idella]
MSVWLLCALLSSLICQTEQDGHSLPIKEVKVYAEKTDTSDFGEWVLNVEWRDELKAGNNESRKVSYDMEVLRTEQMRTVHSETIHVTPDNTALHHWKWTSPIPLQCTSHSVRLRRRDQHHIGEWTPLYTYKGKDVGATELVVYPQDQAYVVGSNITFCCILETGDVLLSSSTFPNRISNRTYITEPVHFDSPSNSSSDIPCDVNRGISKNISVGSAVFIGYPPDDHSLICETQDLSSVKCRWEQGRATHLTAVKTKTIYTLNGRNCEFNKCVLPAVLKQVTNWTLIAKNPLGVKTLTDTADPSHRVLLRAPSKLSHTAYARSVTLNWTWDMINYSSFPMICRVMLLQRKSTYNKTFRGKGLSSIVLDHLQPFTKYTASVSCGSDEHFYNWSEWSDITFTTKEHIPEAVDVWFQHLKQNTCVLWKPLTQQQSHGIITKYELTKGERREIDVGLNKLCYNFTLGNERSDQIITVSARNSAGLSPPSTIIVPGYPGSEVDLSPIISRNGVFEMVWEWDEYDSTCGYVVEWFPTYTDDEQRTVEWMKITDCEHATCRAQNLSCKSGEKCTVSVYACIENKPVLRKRSEGYAIEEEPSGTVQNLSGKQNGRNLELYWDEVPLEQQKGFIQGYKVVTFLSGSKTPVNTTMTKVDQMIATTVVGCSAATLVFIVITVLCYRKRKWLKKLLYPDIPEPKLAGKWNTKGIYCTQMTEGYMKCEIQEVQSSECPATAESTHCLDLISSHQLKSKVFPEQYFYQNISESPADVSYYPPPWLCAQKLTSIIENPSYNMTIPVTQISELALEMQDSYLPAPNFVQKDCVPEQDNVAQISELALEMQDSYLPAPNFVQKDFVVKDSACYKPQST